jgi:hypothetical protein
VITNDGKADKGEYIPDIEDPGPHPGKAFLRWNEANLEYEYWIEEPEGERKALAFSDFALRMLVAQHQRGESTGRIEVVVGTHGGHLKLLSVPLSRLRGFVKEEYDIDI